MDGINPNLNKAPEWYAARKKGITASSVSSTLMQSEDACRLWMETFNQQHFKDQS